MSGVRIELSHDWPQARIAAAPGPAVWRATVDRWLIRLRERADMARMTVRDMRDAGITPYDVGREYAKSFWRE